MNSIGVMILKMSGSTLIYVVPTFLIWNKTKGKELSSAAKIAVGVLFGLLAVASTHFGVNYGSMMINVRDLGPMIAGLFFDPVSGIIAGLIGGIERYIAGTYWNVAPYTCIACSISTCLAGFIAAFMKIYIFRKNNPSTVYAFFMGAVIEVFHMYSVFLTHREDMAMAFYVVQKCSVPMIMFSGIGLALTANAIRYVTGELESPFTARKKEKLPVLRQFQVWLFGVTVVVLLVNFLFNCNLQTQTAIQDSHDDILVAAEDISDTYNALKKVGEHPKHIRTHVGYLGTFSIIDPSGEVIAGYHAGMKDSDELTRIAVTHPKGVFFSALIYDEPSMCYMKKLDDNAILLLRISDEEIFASRDMQAYETMLADIVFFAVIYILISLLVEIIVADKLHLVNESLNRITEGDLDEQVSVYTSSEFASLSDDINETVDVLKGYITAAEHRYEKELSLARAIQDNALPKNFDFAHTGFDLFAIMDPAREVGGDFYDFFFVDINKLALVIADVAGKGIPASLFMMRSKTSIRGLSETGNSLMDVFSKVNRELCEGNDSNMFVTVWMGIVDLETGTVKCINAGHEYPVIMREGGEYEIFREKHSLALGIMEELKFTEYEIDLNPGDRLFLYTDGVPEAVNEDVEAYGTDRMLKALNHYKSKQNINLLPAVRRDIDSFVGKAEPFDDITMMGFEYHGMQEQN